MKFPLILSLCATVAFSASINTFDERFSRNVIVYGDDGKLEIIDTQAPLPEVTATAEDVTLHFYSRNNPTRSEDYPLDVKQVISSNNFDRTKLNIFIIHGWFSDHYSSVNTLIREATIAAEDANVFVVDWSGPAGEWNYVGAAGSTGAIGEAVGEFIGELQETLGIGAELFKVVGFSLGGHVAGNVGRKLNGNLGTIVALDPAGPLFLVTHSEKKLKKTDAKFVQVIHTNGGALGYPGDLGHADYRPNGGGSQPGCGLDLFGTCSHSRAYVYYAESILSGGFTSWSCNSEKDFNENNCFDNPTSPMGGLPIDRTASGNYYLNTNKKSPFSQS